MQKSFRIIGLAGYYDFIRNLNSLLFHINLYALGYSLAPSSSRITARDKLRAVEPFVISLLICLEFIFQDI